MKNIQDELSEICNLESGLANNTLKQLNGIKPTAIQKYFIGVLRRQYSFLNDISYILKNNKPSYLSSVYILFRCLLEDFLHVLFLIENEYNEEIIIQIDATTWNHIFSAAKESMEQNLKFHNGLNRDLFSKEIYENKKNDFVNNPENDKYFLDKERFKFKHIDNVTDIIKKIKDLPSGKANSHAFINWKILSNYIHYSSVTFDSEMLPEHREKEIQLIIELLIYSFKTINISVDFFLRSYRISFNPTPELFEFMSKHLAPLQTIEE